MNELDQILRFITELEKLKLVERRIMPYPLNRRENSAEHSWHIALFALSLETYANEPIDIGRVVQMLLLHDVVEIDCGDVIVYDAQARAKKAIEERAAAIRIFGLLPDELGNRFHTIWTEFENEQTAESLFAKAIDRIMPLFQNLENGAQSWLEHGICKEQVLEVCEPVALGSKALWAYAIERLEAADILWPED